jgi:hypothetical protein
MLLIMQYETPKCGKDVNTRVTLSWYLGCQLPEINSLPLDNLFARPHAETLPNTMNQRTIIGGKRLRLNVCIRAYDNPVKEESDLALDEMSSSWVFGC